MDSPGIPQVPENQNRFQNFTWEPWFICKPCKPWTPQQMTSFRLFILQTTWNQVGDRKNYYAL
jgi:hypothetical protein